jgi:hypothetical protein
MILVFNRTQETGEGTGFWHGNKQTSSCSTQPLKAAQDADRGGQALSRSIWKEQVVVFSHVHVLQGCAAAFPT